MENGFPVRAEGFVEDVLDGQFVLVVGIELAGALGLAEMDPVRSAASALEAEVIDEDQVTLGDGVLWTDFDCLFSAVCRGAVGLVFRKFAKLRSVR